MPKAKAKKGGFAAFIKSKDDKKKGAIKMAAKGKHGKCADKSDKDAADTLGK